MNQVQISIMQTHRIFSLIFVILLISTFSCSNPERSQAIRDQETEHLEPVVEVPKFNQDSAYAYVAKQVAFGPRVHSSKAHPQAASWLIATLGRFADTVQVQKARLRAYDGTILNISNIIASFRPETPNRILLCAHWDSRPFADQDPDPANHYTPIPGANDGASGVGVLIEIARILSENSIGTGIDIILFDAEDYGEHALSNQNVEDSWGLGSQYWAANPHRHDYNARFGILLDMVGASGASFKKEGFSMFYAPDIVRKVWATARKIGYGDYFKEAESGYITDDHYYVNKIRNIPTINIIHQDDSQQHGFFPQWHTMKDDIDIIDPLSLKAVGQTILTVIIEEGVFLP